MHPILRSALDLMRGQGRTVVVDAMQLSMLLDMYRALGVPLVEPKR